MRNATVLVLRARRPLALAASMLCAAPASARQGDVQEQVYQDPVAFEQISSAAQNLLIARFGPHDDPGSKGGSLPATPVATRGERNVRLHGPAVQRPERRDVLGSVLVNDPLADLTAQDTQSETAIVLGAGPNVIAAFNDSGSFLGTNNFTGWAYSLDGGANWTDPGKLPGSNDGGDPVLARDDTLGRTYLACLFFTGAGINVFRSDDDGVTWAPAVNGMPGLSGFQDKPWMVVDNFPGPGSGNLYVASRDFGSGNGIFLSRSTDDGATFSPGFQVVSAAAGNVQGVNLAVGPNHHLYLFYYDSSTTPDEIRVRRSTDLGLSFGAPVTVTALTSTGINGSLSLPAGFRSNSFVQVAANPVSGNLYVAYNDPTAAVGDDRGNILLRQSTDGGASWSASIQVNDDGGTKAQYFPGIAVLADGSGLSVCWYDNRNDAMDRRIERWGATAAISGASLTFGANFRFSPAFDPVFGVDPVVNSVYMGDYDQMAASADAYYTTWGDNRDASLAVPGRKNANVRFTSFAQSGPGALIDAGATTVVGGNLNGLLDPNECNDLFVELRNDGSAGTTGISAILSTVAPGVTVSNAFQVWPDLAPGASATNTAPFRVSTSPAVPCGMTIPFTLTVTSSVGIQPIALDLQAGQTDYVVTVGAAAFLSGTTDIGNHGDDVTTFVALPFPVAFYDTTFNSVVVSSNGNVQFSSASAAYVNECLPTPSLSNAIACHWDDLRTDTTGSGIFTRVVGAAPSRRFVIEWRTTYFSAPGTASFELRLHEDTTDFEIVYGDLSGMASSATIGCQEGTGTRSTGYACNLGGSVGPDVMLSFSLPGCEDGGGECPTTACLTLDFETEDDLVTPLLNGQKITTPPEFGTWVALTSAGANAGAATFDSTPFGQNYMSQDRDLLIGHGNLLILQNSQVPILIGDVFDRPNDDQDGGDLVFDFAVPVAPQSVVLVDIDVGTSQASSVILTDAQGWTRTYTVPSRWTEDILIDGGAGWRTLDLTTLAPQPGFASVATASEQTGFDPTAVVRLRVHLGSSGALDDLTFCYPLGLAALADGWPPRDRDVAIDTAPAASPSSDPVRSAPPSSLR